MNKSYKENTSCSEGKRIRIKLAKKTKNSLRGKKRKEGNGISEAKREKNLLQRGGSEQNGIWDKGRKSSMQLKKAEVISDLA